VPESLLHAGYNCNEFNCEVVNFLWQRHTDTPFTDDFEERFVVALKGLMAEGFDVRECPGLSATDERDCALIGEVTIGLLQHWVEIDL
jgi:hypothetical protein